MTFAAAIREPYVRALGLVSAAHFMSHFYGMVLPPLFPFLNKDLGISYTVLGLILAAQKTTSGFLQLPAGIAVDKFGARTMLVWELFICSVSIGLMSFMNSPILLGVLVILYGIGNCVFHPTDYSILNSSMPENYMGRSFSIHTFCGHIGTAVAPVIILTLTAIWNWRIAVLAAGVVGMAITLMIITQMEVLKEGGLVKRGRQKKADSGETETSNPPDDQPMTSGQVITYMLRSPPLLYLFLFFATSSLAGSGLRDFAVAGLIELQGTPLAAAGGAVSGFFFASAVGVLAGGWVADQTNRHDLVAAASFALAALLIAIIGAIDLHYTVIVFCFTVSGFVNGVIRPARDMMIRTAAPKGATGKVFGFVFSGQSLGGAIAPLCYGLMLDFGKPSWIFFTSAIFLLLCLVVVLLSGRSARRHAPI